MEYAVKGSLENASQQTVGNPKRKDRRNGMAISGLARVFRVWKTFLNEPAAGEGCARSGAEAQGC